MNFSLFKNKIVYWLQVDRESIASLVLNNNKHAHVYVIQSDKSSA